MSDESTRDSPGPDPTEERTVSHTGPSRGVAVPGGTLDPGHVIERYRVIAHLGTGGMGSVYEVEEVDTGRRLALKVLEGGAARGQEARERFLREGRLAASMDHAHAVFVYRADEVDGHLVIAMELMPRGTLRDLVESDGPRPVAEAVDRALELAEALDVAHGLGILHRDLKPSNVFLAPDGSAKLGDFGLSVSTGAVDDELTRKDAFLGTPAYAPPEQLRGRTLDARSDLYALGAVLYFLLTGHAPFEGKSGVALVAAVLEDPPPPIATHERGVPEGLVGIVDRLLQKDPERRFATAAEVARALRPFGSEEIRPAGFGRRMASGAVDGFLCGTLTLPVLHLLNPEGMWADQVAPWQLTLASMGPIVVYTTILEGGFGTSVGRIVAGLRVVARDGRRRPGLLAGFVRAVVFGLLPGIATYVVGNESGIGALWIVLITIGWELLLFTTRRASTGFAAVHDLLSRTRVVEVPEARERVRLDGTPMIGADAEASRSALPASRPAPVDGGDVTSRIGPFRVSRRLVGDDDVVIHAGTDTVLDRAVWVVVRPRTAIPGFDLGTPAALRWLGGRAEVDHRWDGYDAPAPGALRHAVSGERWGVVRRALVGLAAEARALRTIEADATLDPRRIWISSNGTPRLLPVPWPDAPAETPIPVGDVAAIGRFLHDEAFRMLGAEGRGAIPLRARAALDALGGGVSSAEELSANVARLAEGPAEVTARRRAGQLLSVTLTLVFFVLPIAFVASMVNTMTSERPEMETLSSVLERVDELRELPEPKEVDRQEIAELTDYLRDRFEPLTGPDASWGSSAISPIWRETLGPRLGDALAADPRPDEVVPPSVAASWITTLEEDEAQTPIPQGFSLMLILWLALAMSGIVAILVTVVVGAPVVMRVFGIAVVGPGGRPAGRGRLALRGLLAISPLLVGVLIVTVIRRALGIEIDGFLLPTVVFGTSSLVYVGGAVWTALDPVRGGVDRWVGTRLVPR